MIMPVMPNTHAIFVMLLTILALWLFRKDTIPLETSSLVILVILAMSFALFPYHQEGVDLEAGDFFSGFGHEALVAVTALMIIGHGLSRTGALEPVGRMLAKLVSTITVFGGGGEIRTHGPFTDAGFQDRCIRPLCHPSSGRAL